MFTKDNNLKSYPDKQGLQSKREELIMSKLKATGIVRKIDNLGRIVIPIEIRNTLGVTSGEDKDNDAFEIYVSDDTIVLKKYQPGCHFCGSMEDLVEYHDERVCKSCAENLTAKHHGEDIEEESEKESA